MLKSVHSLFRHSSTTTTSSATSRESKRPVERKTIQTTSITLKLQLQLQLLAIMKRKCCSAPEQREKRNKTASSCSSSNSVAGPIGMINQEETSSPSTNTTCSYEVQVQECARILGDTTGMPYATYKKAMEELRDFDTAIFVINMSWEQRLEWFKEMTPPEMEKDFDQWRKTFPLQQ